MSSHLRPEVIALLKEGKFGGGEIIGPNQTEVGIATHPVLKRLVTQPAPVSAAARWEAILATAHAAGFAGVADIDDVGAAGASASASTDDFRPPRVDDLAEILKPSSVSPLPRQVLGGWAAAARSGFLTGLRKWGSLPLLPRMPRHRQLAPPKAGR